MAEMADAADLGSAARQGVEVRVLSSAWARGLAGRRLPCTEEIVGSNPTGSIGNRQPTPLFRLGPSD